MATNKHAIIRYKELDKCLSNSGRKYTFNDLLEAVNNTLSQFDTTTGGIQIRQLRDDIAFMKREDGYSAPIESYREGKKYYYKYKDKDFSINNSPLNSTETEQLKAAISVLQRFNGAPQFEWMNEIGPMLSTQLGLNNSENKIMSYDTNIDYTGYEYITALFNAITNKRVLNITYKPFNQDVIETVFHPYYLKEYNNRWFVLGRNAENNVNTWMFALDRIESIEEVTDTYIETDIDWDDHFYDVIGVTVPTDKEPEEIELLFTAEQANYIKTKPIHGSQKPTTLESGELLVKLKLTINYELETKLLSFGEKVKIIKPKYLANKINNRLKKASEQY